MWADNDMQAQVWGSSQPIRPDFRAPVHQTAASDSDTDDWVWTRPTTSHTVQNKVKSTDSDQQLEINPPRCSNPKAVHASQPDLVGQRVTSGSSGNLDPASEGIINTVLDVGDGTLALEAPYSEPVSQKLTDDKTEE